MMKPKEGSKQNGAPDSDKVRTNTGPVMRKMLQGKNAIEPPNGQLNDSFGKIDLPWDKKVQNAQGEVANQQKFESDFPANEFEELIQNEFRRLKYKITGRIGQGGMGEVYDAQYQKPGSFGIPEHGRVAIKLIAGKFENDPESRTRFFMEEEFLREVKDHPNFIDVYTKGEIGGRVAFIVMEHLKGKDVGTIIDEEKQGGGTIGVEKALKIILEVCSALIEAHSREIIHRDIKPDNIFLLDDGRVKVIDFGVAKLGRKDIRETLGLTQVGVSIGTPLFMAPEMFADESGFVEHDHRADLYSLGMTMYEMICGVLPFEVEGYLKAMALHKFRTPKRMRRMRPDLDIPEGVNDLVMRALEKEPEKRFQSAEEMKKAIEACLSKLGKWDPVRTLKKAAKWAAAAAVAGGLAFGVHFGVQKLSEPSVEEAARMQGVYTAKIETNEEGVSVVEEERLDDGTLVTRVLGQTPFAGPMEGIQTVYLELEGHERKYLTVTPEMRTFSVDMAKRE